jgi:membrane protease YdiL (CAAX protease family)
MASNKTAQDSFFAQLGQRYAPPPWSLFEAGLAFGVLLIGLLLIGTVIAANLSPDNATLTPQGQVIGWLVGLTLAAAFVLVRWRSSTEKFAALRLVGITAQSERSLVLVFMLGIGMGLTANLSAALGSNGHFETIAPLQGIYTSFALPSVLLGSLFALIVQPAAESLIFFGVIQPRLRATCGAYGGLLLTAVLYAATYYLVYGVRAGVVLNPFWYGFVAPLICGLTLGVVRVWLRSTRAALVAHVGAGVVAVLVMLTV